MSARQGPLQVALGTVLAVGYAWILVLSLRGDLPIWGAILSTIVLGAPLLAMLHVAVRLALARRAALAAARELVSLAREAAARGASPGAWDQARAAADRVGDHVTAAARDEVCAALLPGVEVVGPLRGQCARAAALTRSADPRLEAALGDLRGIQGLDELEAVAGWLREHARDRVAALAALAHAAPPEARRAVVARLLQVAGAPDPARAGPLRPFKGDVAAIAREARAGGGIPDTWTEAWAAVLADDDGGGAP